MKKRTLRRYLSLILSLMMIISVIPVSTMAADSDISTYITYETTETGAVITACSTAVSGDLVIPAELDGMPVTEIGEYAFKNCKSLKSITVPDTVTSIGDYAFWNTGLEAFTVPGGISEMPEGMLSGCKSLTSVTVPENITAIGGWAFNGCTSLVDISIPDSVTSTGSCVFAGCISLKNVELSKNLKTVSDRMFYGCKALESIKIPEGTVAIDSSAFASCTKLTDVSIPDGLTSIGAAAFKGCSALNEIAIPESVTSISEEALLNTGIYKNAANWENNVLYFDNILFSAKTALTGDCAVREQTRFIANKAFYGCKKLTGVSIPGSVKTIGSYAFYNDTAVVNVELCEGIEEIGKFAFYSNKMPSLTIPDSVKTIGQYAFGECNSLQTLSLSSGLRTVDDYAFSGCTRLRAAVFSDGLETLGNGVFSGCTQLCETALPDTLELVGENAYRNTAIYNNASSWTDDVLYINNILICGKTTVTDLYDVEDGTIMIAKGAFKGCDELTDIMIPGSVKIMGAKSFGYDANGEKLDGRVIRGLTNTAAHTYATENDIPFVCTHILAEGEAVEATCSAAGHSAGTYCILCGEAVSVPTVMSALPHTEEIIPGVEPTCTKTGLTEGVKCSVCGEILVEQEIIPVKAHEYTAAVTEATCTEGGYTTYTCVCGDTYVDDYTPVKAHETVETVTPAKCEEDGVITRKCANCDYAETEVIPATGHIDADGDNKCDFCAESMGATAADSCDCVCHKDDAISKFILAISKIVWFFSGKHKVCACGVSHF